MTAQRCWTNQRITPWLEAAMKTLTKSGHSPEYHTVVLETTDERQWQRVSQTRRSEARPHKQQTTLCASDHEVAQVE